jgi:flagellar protein FliO/FliZ
MQGPLTFFLAFVAVLVLIGLAAWLVRRFATNRLGTNTNRGRMPRLAVIDAAAVDGRRRLVLVRRDNVEHLLMIGGPTDIVVEPNIVRAMPGRDQMAPRPSVAGEQPPRIAPLPDAGWNDDGARDPFDHAEPQMPEPPPRPARPSFADEVRRPAPPPMAERRGDRSDPLAGFAPEPMAGRAEPRPDPVPPRVTRTEPMMPRPQRPMEPPKAPPPVRAPERAAAPPLPPPPPAPPPQSSADQNLAEMAQRLEAALRRPADAPIAPPVAPEPPPARPARSEAPAPAPQKSGFENLEDEMASLLGRPKSPS